MNKRKHYTFSAVAALLAAGTVLSIMMTEPALAKKPFTAAEHEDQRNALLAAVAKGDALWHSPKLGSNGLACANCHPDASAANPETWPKYQTNLGKVGTLRDMINWCIQVPLEGKTIDPDSDDMIAMEAYATYMSRGIPLSPGKDYQSGADPVKSGPGYPTGDDGDL
jgi:thiosulfate dehydrogenase